MNLRKRGLRIAFILLAGVTLLCPGVAVQDDATEDSNAGLEAGETSESIPFAFPSRLPDGRSLYPIGIYQSQMAELIPDDYRPVSIDKLRAAIERVSEQSTDQQIDRIRNAEYWIELKGDTLVSDRSAIDLESSRETLVRRKLGRVNFSLRQPSNRNLISTDPLPRLESSSDGELIAVFQGGIQRRTRIEFQWQLSGRQFAAGHEFVLRLPRTPQTRILLAAPADVRIEAVEGVLRSRPGPPFDAGEFTTNRDLRWYEIDAGGLATITLRTIPTQTPLTTALIVRRSLIQYEIDQSGLSWVQRMSVQLPVDQPFPVLRISDSTVTSVKINGSEVSFSADSIDDRNTELTIKTPVETINPQATSTMITITGQSTWDDWCDLPTARFLTGAESESSQASAESGIVYGSATDEVQIAVALPLEIVDWELPKTWSQTKSQSAEGVRFRNASGPPVGLLEPDSNSAWSRVRFAQRPSLRRCETWLRTEVGKGTITAKARFRVTMDADRLEPLELRIQDGFSVDSITLANSNRVIELPALMNTSDVITLWPHWDDTVPSGVVSGPEAVVPADDAGKNASSQNGKSQVGGVVPEALTPRIGDPDASKNPAESSGNLMRDMVIDVTGTRMIPFTMPVVTVPPCWLAKVDDVRGGTTASIIPPPDLNWSGEAALKRDRIREADLSSQQLSFLSGGDRPTLYFAPSPGRTPEVLLEMPNVAFNVSSVVNFARDGDDVLERLVIDVESAGQRLTQMSVQTGPPNQRPDYQWSLGGDNGVASTSLPPSDIRLGTGEEEGTYVIDVSEINLRGRSLIARRRYTPQSEFSLSLPSVPGAATQRSEVLIGNGLVVRRKSASVQLVALLDPVNSPEVDVPQDDPEVDSQEDPVLLRPKDFAVHQRLRYDAVEQPVVVIAKEDDDGSVTMVWDEKVRVIASSRGTDHVEATYRVSPTGTLQIRYEPDLRLASITRDGKPVDLLTIPQHPIELAGRGKTETIRVVWNRSRFGSRWIRQCTMPRIDVSGVVMKSVYELVPASDTFSPLTLFRDHWQDSSTDAVEVGPGESAMLVRRNVALALGWLVALIAFAMGWTIASRSPLIVAMIVAILTAMTLLWWPWKLAVIGWVIVPIIASAMLATARAWTCRGSRLDDEGEHAGGSVIEIGPEGKSDLSWAAIVRMIVLAILISGPMQLVASAQQDATKNASPVSTPSSGKTANDDSGQPTSTVQGPSGSFEPVGSPRENGSSSSLPPAVAVLVPIDAVGKTVGGMVYLSRSVNDWLFRKDAPEQIVEPFFQSADYRVRLRPALSSDSPNTVGSGVSGQNGADVKRSAAISSSNPGAAEVTSSSEATEDPGRINSSSNFFGLATTVEAEFVIHLVDDGRSSNQVRLPIPFASVRRVEWIDDVDRIVRSIPDENGQLIASLPRGSLFRLRVTMTPSVKLATPWNRLSLKIPPVAASKLTIESEQNLAAVRINGSRGRILTETDLRRWVTELGPTESLNIEYRAATSGASISPQPLRRRYWISAGKTQAVIECEVDPPTAIAAGETFQFVIRDAEMPLVTSPHWRLAGSELYSPTRRLVTVSAKQDVPGPIRLLWSRECSLEVPGIASRMLADAKTLVDALAGQPPGDGSAEKTNASLTVGDRETSEYSLTIPEVIAAALGENAPAWIAFHTDRSMRLAPFEQTRTEPLSVDQFMAAWPGYRGLIDRAVVAMGALPTPRFQISADAPTRATVKHHLHVMPDRLELRCEATLMPSQQPGGGQWLSVPNSMELIQLSIDGVPAEPAHYRSDSGVDYMLDDFTGNEPVVILATAAQTLPKDRRFSPPRLQLSGVTEISETYLISRDDSAQLQVIQPVPWEPLNRQPVASSESLAHGWIPVSTWITTPQQLAASPQQLGGIFQVRAQKTRFDCRQLISVTRDDGRWKTQTRIQFDGDRLPDFIDVEVPTRWCESLDVSPTTSWSRQPAIDPAQQVIRIRCDREELTNQTLTVTGQLQNSDAGRVGVPNVRVLGFGRRRIHISVPDRLTNEAIRWRTSAVEAVAPPKIWADSIDASSARSTYLAANPSWSIDLAPLPAINADAIALRKTIRHSSRTMAFS